MTAIIEGLRNRVVNTGRETQETNRQEGIIEVVNQLATQIQDDPEARQALRQRQKAAPYLFDQGSPEALSYPEVIQGLVLGQGTRQDIAG